MVAALIAASLLAVVTEIRIAPGEEWRGLATGIGEQMPITADSALEVDLRKDGHANQYASLLLSNRGR